MVNHLATEEEKNPFSTVKFSTEQSDNVASDFRQYAKNRKSERLPQESGEGIGWDDLNNPLLQTADAKKHLDKSLHDDGDSRRSGLRAGLSRQRTNNYALNDFDDNYSNSDAGLSGYSGKNYMTRISLPFIETNLEMPSTAQMMQMMSG